MVEKTIVAKSTSVKPLSIQNNSRYAIKVFQNFVEILVTQNVFLFNNIVNRSHQLFLRILVQLPL